MSRIKAVAIIFLLHPGLAFASQGHTADLMNTGLAVLALAIFIVAYAVVMAEEFIHLRKSKPVILAAGLIWLIVAILSQQHGIDSEVLRERLEHNLAEYSALFLFLLVAPPGAIPC